MASHSEPFHLLEAEIANCRKCARLAEYREHIGVIRRRAYRDHEYWAKAVPGFGDAQARVLIIGLAPAAHGANRTGRMFTGDRSGEFLYRALYENGFANQPSSIGVNDGLHLTDAYITAPVRCAPPDNKPTPDELLTCRPYLVRELDLLSRVKVVVVLGGIALNAYISVLRERGAAIRRAAYPFGHGLEYQLYPAGPRVLTCYHPSQQNTSTKRLTARMLRDVFARARALADADD